MTKMSEERSVRRLGRAIASDIKLYNEEAIGNGADLSSVVAEGRELFEQRVSQPLHAIFDEEMKAHAPDVRYGSASAPARAADKGLESFFADEADPAGKAGKAGADNASTGRAVFVLIALVAAAVIIYLVTSR